MFFLAIKIAPRKKRRCLLLSEQREVLRLIDEGRSYSWIEQKTGTPRSTISKIKSRREKINQRFAAVENAGSSRKIREVTHPAVEKATFLWFLQQRDQHLPMTIDLIRKKAIAFHQSLCDDDRCSFSASFGWAQKFVARHCLRTLKISGEKLSADSSALEPFKQKLVQLIQEMGLTLDQIYNADESGLIYKALPSSTLVSNEEKSAPGRKIPKERITFTPCSNITGSNKVPIQLIGKAMRPRCFAGKSLPENIFYTNSQNAWQTRELFKKYLVEVFIPSVKLYSEQQGISPKAILVLDNATSHSEFDDLGTTDIRVLFLPPNSTAIAQPMDQSVILPLKVRYRAKLLQQLILSDDWVQKLKQFNLYDATKLISESWEDLETSVIVKSWKPLLQGFKPYDNLYQIQEKISNLPEHLAGQIKKMLNKLNVAFGEANIDEWLNSIHELGSEQLTDERILQLVRTHHCPDADKDDEDSEQEEEIELHYEIMENEDVPKNMKQVDDAFCTLIEYFKREDSDKLILLNSWRNEFLDKVTLN